MFKNLNIFRPIIAILILFIPLYPKFPLTSVDGTYVAIRLDDVVIALTILIWAIYQLTHKLPVFKIKITKLFLAYFTAIIASFITAFLVYQTDSTTLLLLHLARRFEYISLFFIAIDSIKSKQDLNFSYIFLLITTFFVSIYGYGQKYFQFPVISTMNSEFSKGQLLQMSTWTRINSTFAGHYDLAAFLSVVLIIIAAVFILNKNKWIKLFSLVVWVASYPILTFTASRVSIFAFLAGICFTLFALRKYFWIIPFVILVAFSIFNSEDLNQRLLATIPALKNQINKTTTATITPTATPTSIPVIAVTTPIPTSTKLLPTPTVVRHPTTETYPTVDVDAGVARSGEIRFNVEWPRAIRAFNKNMITGTGLGSITLATDNDYLRLLGESGLLGFISFMIIPLYFIIKTVPKIFKKKSTIYDQISIIFLGCLLTTLANAVFIDVFEASKTAYLFWIMMGFYYQLLNFKDEK
ncbi:MAG: O-antigen ligase family protein [Candidatus Shapirobacteria bacterium]|nr:O-antigen ligase family protein [Candidatus Shapirobacteria bacterium]MDD4383246.1 O-antigen ligase family protein [Candidatus Shapirobacteria bacterium]